MSMTESPADFNGGQFLQDPILPIYREWNAARQDWIAAEAESPEAIAAEAREWAAYKALLEMEPISAQGVAALAHVLWTLEGPPHRPDLPEFAERCADPGPRLMAAIWRFGSGLQGVPPGL